MLHCHVPIVAQYGQTIHRPFHVFLGSSTHLEGEGKHWKTQLGAICNFSARCHLILHNGHTEVSAAIMVASEKDRISKDITECTLSDE